MKIEVTVKSNAKEKRIEKINNNQFLVWVKARPQNGKANQAVVKVLAEYFGVAQLRVVLLKGRTSRQKMFQVISNVL